MSNARQSSFVYVTYIRTTPEKLWRGADRAGIHPPVLGRHLAGVRVEAGRGWRIMIPDGRVGDHGEVLEIEPHRRLVLSWRNEFKPELRAEGYSRADL